ncbi:MAG: hypothetical protein LUF35_06970 [Lachnospiraceae bacterium]|nr:hypothetical protein [Lachnospiraceae bacterium]
MNKLKRKRLETAFEQVSSAKRILEDVKAEEEDAYDNLPEQFQNGERGEEMQGYVEMLEEAFNYLDDAASVIEQI